MITETYRFAELTVRVSTVYKLAHHVCAAYRTEQRPVDFDVRTAEADVEFERAQMEREDAYEAHVNRTYPDAYLELLAVHRRISEQLPRYGAFLMHGSCVAVDGEAYLFTAKSGTGKSTHARLWRDLFGTRAETVNDDKPFLRVAESGVIAYGSPWDGKHRLSSNIAVPLKGIAILERAETNAIRRVSFGEAYPMLLQQIYRPLDAAALEKTLSLIDRLQETVDLWLLGCNMDPDAAKVASAAMRGTEN